MHDYIINTTKYDSERSDNNVINYKSDIAYGPLFEGYALCGGYTDLYELLLEQMHIKSFKVSGDIHIWNAIELNGTWYNLDLTWDDPVTTSGEDRITHDYFLIDSNKLLGGCVNFYESGGTDLDWYKAFLLEMCLTAFFV